MLVFGTNNKRKGIELAELLAPYNIEVQTLADFETSLDVHEDGRTFLENARKKASEQAKFLRCWVLGEDSGLCVDALKGAPGIYSARFASSGKQNASDEANNQLLLDKLQNVPFENRTAHYVCAAALADPSGEIRCEAENYCRGRIRLTPSGTGGFGYDPLFEIAEYHRTFGDLSAEVKRILSHRSRTIRTLLPPLINLLAKNG